MRINYLNFQEDLFTGIITSKDPRVYIFDNTENINQAREYYQKSFLEQRSLFLGMKEFKEKLFPTEKLILKEEKLAVLFYELLTEQEKQELKIDDYFDAIELANEFFDFFKELNEYGVREITGLREWQQHKYQILLEIRKRYLDRLDELNFTDETLAFNFENFNDQFLRDYKEIVFVNVLNFTPKERKMLELLEDRGYNLALYLQIQPGDFDEDKLCLKSVSLPDKPETEIEVFYTEEDILQLANLISLIKEDEELCILNADNNSSYYRLLSTEKIAIDQDISFTETKIYRYLDALYNLLTGADMEQGVLKLELNKLLEAIYLPEFRDYYGLDITSIDMLQELVRDDYAYFALELKDKYSGLEGFQAILNDIKKISQIKNIRELTFFLESIDLADLNDRHFAKNVTRYFDALLELRSLEEMGIVSSWSSYFEDKARGLFRLALNYLRYKKVETICNPEAKGVKMANLLGAPHLGREKVVILNASRGVIPSEEGNGFLLTDRQRVELGLPAAEDLRLRQKYLFYRHLLGSKKANIFSLKNLEKNLTTSSFVDELILKYGLKATEAELKAKDLSRIMGNIFPDRVGGLKIKEKDLREDSLIMEATDFYQQSFSLTYYKHKTLNECYYKFYLEHIARLEERMQPGKEITPKLLGIIVHEVFADVIERTGANLDISTELVEEIINIKLTDYRLKVNNYYFKYYRDVLFNKIRDAVLHFYKVLQRKASSGIDDMKIEWKPDHDQNNFFYEDELAGVYLNGRIDLLLESGDQMQLIDFKTGGGSTDQLDFYALLINPGLDPDIKIERGIYDVMNERYLPGSPGAEVEFAEKIQENLKEFFGKGEYEAVFKKSLCNNCNWIDICRVVIE